MRNILRSTCLAAICAVLPSLSTGAAMAAPIGALVYPIGEIAAASSNVETVQFARRGGGRGVMGMRNGRNFAGRRGNRSRGNFGRNAGIGIGAAIIGGVLLSEATRSAHRRDHGSDWERCEETYRSFEPSTGMYTGYDGIRRPCPYLN